MQFFSTLVLYFSAMAFAGWFLETVFRSFQQRKLVNPGFLQGPFVAVYGFGGVGIYLVTLLLPFDQWGIWAWVLILVLPSVVEYVAGWFTETIFHLKLWDYSELPFHLHGRICLYFSVVWGILSVIVVVWIQPFLLSLLEMLSLEWRWLLTGWLSMYLVVDFWFSAKMYQRYAVWITHLKENLVQLPEKILFPSLSLRDTQRYFRHLFQPLHAFPHLARQFREKIKEFPESFRDFVKRFLPKE
ncbi:MAG: putative ABC transporter permease [Brevinematales bacterium]|nr:putative ABC transporter permease [Brevinematales bacterium]